VYTGSQSTSSLPRRLKLAVERTNSNTSSTSNSVKHNSGTKVPTTAAKPRTAGKIGSDGRAMLETAGRIEAGEKYDEEMEADGGGGQKKKFSFVGLISEDMR
jgi:hypothetical protein